MSVVQELEPCAEEGGGAVLELLEQIRSEPSRRLELVPLLHQAHPIYQGHAGAEVIRLRALVLQTFEVAGLPPQALPYVLGELQTGQHADTLAAASRALRGGEPSPAWIPWLERALDNARGRDEYVTFESLTAVGSRGSGTTLRRELEATLSWLRAASATGGCCCEPVAPDLGVRRLEPGARTAPGEVMRLELEDQDGRRLPFAELFIGRPAVVAFFYTRCDNPRRCSLTISRLAGVQRQVERRGLAEHVAIGAISYDAPYDTPQRLRAYGLARGFTPSNRQRLLRPTAESAALRGFFDSAASYCGSIVTQHGLELYVLDAQGRVAVAFQQLEWSPAAVVDELARLLAEKPASSLPRAFVGVLPALGLALVPKCPMCWVGYANVLGVAGLEVVGSWAAPLLLLLLFANLAYGVRQARRAGRYWPCALSAAGVLTLLVAHQTGADAWLGVGIALTSAGALAAPLLRGLGAESLLARRATVTRR